MKILVLGGTRFVGLRVLRYLSEIGHDVTILNRGKTQAQLPDGITRLYADRRDSEKVRQVLANLQFDVVCDFTSYEARNLEPIVELLAGKIKQYIFQSTTAVYGETSCLPVLEEFPTAGGSAHVRGADAYGTAKAVCERYLFSKYDEIKFPVTIIRCPFLYGPENWMHDREFSFFVRLRERRPILIPGNGSTVMHFAYIDDLAMACASLIGRDDVQGQAFNIAGAEAVSIEGYVDNIAEVVGIEADKHFIDYSILHELKKPVFPFPWNFSAYYSISKAREYFGFWPEYSMVQGLSSAYEWWKECLGENSTRFEAGRLGYDVDLEYEAEVIGRI